MAGARQQIADAQLESDVEYAGEVLDVVALFATADLFLLPSATESFGLAALEAMACEVPVIASRVGGLPEVIDDGISGFLHEPDDLDGMVASAVRLLTDDELHRRVARAGRATAAERYSADRVVPQYEAAYEQLLQTETV
jgi:glycosyltransferase involved in cell wall biosynthesis